LEGFVSMCRVNFEGFTNSALRTTLHKTHYGFSVLLPAMEVKPNFKCSSKYLRSCPF